MDVPVSIRLGLIGPDAQLGCIRLGRRTIDFACSHFGAYHILEMGRHFDDYVIAWPPAALHMVMPGHFALRRTGKVKAPVVTGNIGETVAGLVFRRKLMVSVAQLLHVFPTPRFRTPDYLVDFTSGIPHPIRGILANQAVSPATRWPVESKAGKSNGTVNRGVASALQQLASFWHHRAPVDAAVVGYGVIVTLRYQQVPEVVIRIIEPNNQTAIQDEISTSTVTQFASAFSEPSASIRRALRNVS